MKVAAISTNDNNRKNMFIHYANSFMNFKANSDENSPSEAANPIIQDKKISKTMGIETLTIFPKQVIDGKTVITA